MSKIITGAHFNTEGTAIGLWLADKLQWNITPPFTAIAFIDDNDKLSAAFVFTDYNKSNIDIHGFSHIGLTRKQLRAIIKYVFVQLKCVRLTSKVNDSQNNLKNILPRIGFEKEATLTNFFGDGKHANRS